MQLADQLILSASDITGFLACQHLTTLELKAAEGQLRKPQRHDPLVDLLARLGDEHEEHHLKRFVDKDFSIARIPRMFKVEELTEAERLTREAMENGVDVIYQATFFDGRWRGHADFLRRVERPSDLGEHSYEVLDAKLARTPKGRAVLQLCNYSEHVTRIQGQKPRQMHLILGDHTVQSFNLRDYIAYYRTIKSQFETFVTHIPDDTYPDPVEHCGVCRWWSHCIDRRRTDDHLSLVASIRRDQIKKLNTSGIDTLQQLGEREPFSRVVGVAPPTFARLQDQAALQLLGRQSGKPEYKIIPPPGDSFGLEMLPEPTEHDLFFDIEGDPYVSIEGLQFLFGLSHTKNGELNYRSWWAHNPAEEREMVEQFIDHVTAQYEANPTLNIYHYSPAEPSSLKRLVSRYGTREEELDRLLRAKVFVDLYRVVKQGLRISKESYSIKQMEAFYGFQRTDPITGQSAAIIEYEKWLETGEEHILRDLEEYNRADCDTMLFLRDWLEERRHEAEEEFQRPMSRPVATGPGGSPELSQALQRTADLVEALTKDVNPDPDNRTEDEAARWLLAQLLGWHRRESKSEWWAYYDRLGKTPEELVEDNDCLGALTYEGPVREEAKSTVHALTFPAQEHKIGPGDYIDPVHDKGVKVIEVNDVAQRVLIKRGTKRDDPPPPALIPGSPIDTSQLRKALERVAEGVIAGGLSGNGDNRSFRDLLLRKHPRLQNPGDPLLGEGESTLKAACRVALSLSDSYLPIQGPPGTGKTYTGAHLIVALVSAGHKVGITATSHKVISNLLDDTLDIAAKSKVSLKALQRINHPEDASLHDDVELAKDNAKFASEWESGEYQVAAGTPWLFAREEHHALLHTLVIDEAGQFSLANAGAVAGSARDLVLLGDPQQLAQPSQGVHPPGSGASVLEHILHGRDTISADQGLFLSTTYRMHPDVCSFVSDAFYEGRLTSEALCAQQVISSGGRLSGAGIHFIEVPHAGNRVASIEEADVIAELVHELLDQEWTNEKGEYTTIEGSKILVVAPYNRQVALLRSRLPSEIPVGTVDKFQGQEGAVTIYSPTTSDPEDVPRNFEFLYSHNRLNVAVSRARAISVVVGSPALLRPRCRTPDQMWLANALCLYRERSRPIGVVAG